MNRLAAYLLFFRRGLMNADIDCKLKYWRQWEFKLISRQVLCVKGWLSALWWRTNLLFTKLLFTCCQLPLVEEFSHKKEWALIDKNIVGHQQSWTDYTCQTLIWHLMGMAWLVFSGWWWSYENGAMFHLLNPACHLCTLWTTLMTIFMTLTWRPVFHQPEKKLFKQSFIISAIISNVK